MNGRMDEGLGVLMEATVAGRKERGTRVKFSATFAHGLEKHTFGNSARPYTHAWLLTYQSTIDGPRKRKHGFTRSEATAWRKVEAAGSAELVHPDKRGFEVVRARVETFR